MDNERILAILEEVSKHSGFSTERLLDNKRGTRKLTQARQLAMYIAREFGFTLEEIGNALNRDHSTIAHGYLAVKDRLESDSDLHDTIRLLKAKLDSSVSVGISAETPPTQELIEALWARNANSAFDDDFVVSFTPYHGQVTLLGTKYNLSFFSNGTVQISVLDHVPLTAGTVTFTRPFQLEVLKVLAELTVELYGEGGKRNRV